MAVSIGDLPSSRVGSRPPSATAHSPLSVPKTRAEVVGETARAAAKAAAKNEADQPDLDRNSYHCYCISEDLLKTIGKICGVIFVLFGIGACIYGGISGDYVALTGGIISVISGAMLYYYSQQYEGLSAIADALGAKVQDLAGQIDRLGQSAARFESIAAQQTVEVIRLTRARKLLVKEIQDTKTGLASVTSDVRRLQEEMAALDEGSAAFRALAREVETVTRAKKEAEEKLREAEEKLAKYDATAAEEGRGAAAATTDEE